MSSRKAVICVGIAVRDVIFSVESLPAGPGKTHATARREVGGGPAANAAVAISRLGGATRFIGPLGDDPLGEELVEELSTLDVDTSRVRSIPDASSPLSTVVVDPTGERTIVNHTDRRLFEEAEPIVDGDLDGADAVLVDVRWLNGAVTALEWAGDRGIPGIVDFDIGADESLPLLEKASHVVFSSDALRRVAGKADLETALLEVSRHTGAWMGVTDGPEGTFWLDNGVVHHAAAFEVDVVDTTGAGDIYHGVFALALAEGKSEKEAIELSSAAAAISCTRFGGRSGIPDRRELEAFLEERQ